MSDSDGESITIREEITDPKFITGFRLGLVGLKKELTREEYYEEEIRRPPVWHKPWTFFRRRFEIKKKKYVEISRVRDIKWKEAQFVSDKLLVCKGTGIKEFINRREIT